jgi:hypothetical protein
MSFQLSISLLKLIIQNGKLGLQVTILCQGFL